MDCAFFKNFTIFHYHIDGKVLWTNIIEEATKRAKGVSVWLINQIY